MLIQWLDGQAAGIGRQLHRSWPSFGPCGVRSPSQPCAVPLAAVRRASRPPARPVTTDAGPADGGEDSTDAGTDGGMDAGTADAGTLTLTTTAFVPGGPIPLRYECSPRVGMGLAPSPATGTRSGELSGSSEVITISPSKRVSPVGGERMGSRCCISPGIAVGPRRARTPSPPRARSTR